MRPAQVVALPLEQLDEGDRLGLVATDEPFDEGLDEVLAAVGFLGVDRPRHSHLKIT
jgi:hypothetical protein